MKTTKISTIVFALILIGCKSEPEAFSNFKYTDKGVVLNCETLDTKLYNEALFAFENDMIEFYSKGQSNITRSYSFFVRDAVNGRAKYAEILSPHTVEVFEALKRETNLWNLNDANSNLNYDSPLFKCIVDNIQSNDLKTTLNALLTTNSMSPKLFGPPLQSQYSQAIRDKYLSAYMAFDLFYAKLFDVDLSQVKAKETEENKENTSEAPLTDPHAGHNH